MTCADPQCPCQRISRGDGTPIVSPPTDVVEVDVKREPDEPTVDGVFDRISLAEKQIDNALSAVRDAQLFLPSILETYGGPGYPRHLSLAVTKLEEALLWLGCGLPNPNRI
jgi:hypothetical protein